MNKTLKTRIALVIAAVSLSAPLLGTASAQDTSGLDSAGGAVYTSSSAPACSVVQGDTLCAANAGRIQVNRN